MSSESLLIVTISRSLLSRLPVSPAIEPESLFYELGGGGVTRGYSFQMILNGYSLFSPHTGASLLQIYAATDTDTDTELKMAQFVT